MTNQLVLPLEPRNAMTRDDFIVRPGNAKAFAFIDAWPGWPAPAAALYGAPASGKTHLAHVWAVRAQAVICDASELTAPVAGPAVIENCDARSAPAHILFAQMEQGTPLLMTGRRAPSDWPASLPDLVSRYRALLAFELGAPDEALLLALAVKLFADRQIEVPETVILHLVRQLERSPGAIRDVIAAADMRALAEQRPVTLPLIRALMAERAAD